MNKAPQGASNISTNEQVNEMNHEMNTIATAIAVTTAIANLITARNAAFSEERAGDPCSAWKAEAQAEADLEAAKECHRLARRHAAIAGRIAAGGPEWALEDYTD